MIVPSTFHLRLEELIEFEQGEYHKAVQDGTVETASRHRIRSYAFMDALRGFGGSHSSTFHHCLAELVEYEQSGTHKAVQDGVYETAARHRIRSGAFMEALNELITLSRQEVPEDPEGGFPTAATHSYNG